MENEWTTSEWIYIESLEDLKGFLSNITSDAEIKKDVRLVTNLKTGESAVQFREHDFS